MARWRRGEDGSYAVTDSEDDGDNVELRPGDEDDDGDGGGGGDGDGDGDGGDDSGNDGGGGGDQGNDGGGQDYTSFISEDQPSQPSQPDSRDSGYAQEPDDWFARQQEDNREQSQSQSQTQYRAPLQTDYAAEYTRRQAEQAEEERVNASLWQDITRTQQDMRSQTPPEIVPLPEPINRPILTSPAITLEPLPQPIPPGSAVTDAGTRAPGDLVPLPQSIPPTISDPRDSSTYTGPPVPPPPATLPVSPAAENAAKDPTPENVSSGALNAAQTTLDQGGTPDEAQAAAAVTAAMIMATDKQTLGSQDPWTRNVFRGTYGQEAEREWARQHNAELQRNRALYGSDEPPAGTAPVAGAPAGTPLAPNRRIGVTPPPASPVAVAAPAAPAAGAASAAPAAPAAGAAPAPAAAAAAVPPAVPARPAAPATPAAGTTGAAPAVPAAGAAQAPTAPAAPGDVLQPGTDIPPADQVIVPRGLTRLGRLVNDSPINIALAPDMPHGFPDVPADDPVAKEYLTSVMLDTMGAAGNSDPALRALGDKYLTRIAQVAWYRSLGGQINGQPIVPEDASNAWTTSWVDQFRKGAADQIPMGGYVEALLRANGRETPSEYVRRTQPGAAPTGIDSRNRPVPGGRPVETGTPPTTAPSTVPTAATIPPAEGRPTPLGTVPTDGIPTSRTPLASLSTPTLTQSIDTTAPIETLISVTGRGITPEEVRSQTQHVVGGITALLKGDPAGKWAESYLNDTARLAWSRQERESGRVADPRNAPVEYVEKWKDAFYGRDARVPLVKELDQQLLDYGAERTAPGKPYNWREVYGEKGENGLISRQVSGIDCGPNAFSIVLRSQGYNADPKTTFPYAVKYNYHNGDAFNGSAAMVRMLHDEAGLDAEEASLSAPNTWKTVQTELDAGRPVMLSGPGHYWAITGYRDGAGGREYYAGATGTVVGNGAWVKQDGFNYKGPPNVAIFARGAVDPSSRSVREMGLRPPGPVDTRGLLSSSGNAPSALPPGTPAAPSRDSGRPGLMYRQPMTSRTENANLAEGVDAGVPVRPNLNPVFTEQDTNTMRDRIINEMPQIQFDPGDDIDTRFRKAAPALQWLAREYGVPDDLMAGMMYNESHVGLVDSPASRANNLLSVEWNKQYDTLATGYAPGQPAGRERWAAYPTINANIARMVGVWSHPDNTNYKSLWQNRQQGRDAVIQGLIDGKYIVGEPGAGNSVAEWRNGVLAGADKYRKATGGR